MTGPGAEVVLLPKLPAKPSRITRTLARLTKSRGANWGANDARYWATSGHSQRLLAQLNDTSGHIQPPLATARVCLLSSGSQVRILPGAQVKDILRY